MSISQMGTESFKRQILCPLTMPREAVSQNEVKKGKIGDVLNNQICRIILSAYQLVAFYLIYSSKDAHQNHLTKLLIFLRTPPNSHDAFFSQSSFYVVQVGDISCFKMRQKPVLHISYQLEVVNPTKKAAGLNCILVYPLSDHSH